MRDVSRLCFAEFETTFGAYFSQGICWGTTAIAEAATSKGFGPTAKANAWNINQLFAAVPTEH
jgi:hypothetical protein